MKVLDSLRSLVSGLGSEKDKTLSTEFVFAQIPFTELTAMHRSDWLSRKVVDIIPSDMTREWREWQTDADKVELLEKEEAKFNVQPKINWTMQAARLYGGACLVIGIKGQDPAQELVLDSVKQGMLEYLHVLNATEVSADELERDVTSPYFMQPKFYMVNGKDGTQARIHPSRIIRMIGAVILDNRVADAQAWGDSVLQIVYSAIQNAGSVQQHIAALVPEAKTDVVYIPGLAEYAATLKGQTALTNRFTYANMAKSMFNMLLLDGTGAVGKAGEGQGEKWEQKQINFAQLPELMQQFLKVAAGAADIPLMRLLQDAPSGLGATGEGSLSGYYDNISARQRTELTPAINQLDEVIIRSALGTRDPDIYYTWSPLWNMSEKERAEIFKLKADAARALVGSGAGEIIPIEAVSDALINRLVEDGDLPGLEEAIEEYGKLADQEDDDEQLLAAATQRGLVAPPPKMVRAANDARPRSLYVRRDVLNKAEIERWAKSQGLKAADDLHVTVMYSTTPVDWMKIRPSWQDKVEIVGGPRLLDKLGPPESPVVALLIPMVGELTWRHEEMKDAGAESAWPEYIPHITIQKGDAAIDELEPYQGRILLGPEVFEEVQVGDSLPFFLGDKKKKHSGEGNPGFNPSQPRGSNGQWIETGAGEPVKAAAAKAAATSKYSAEKVQGLTSKNPKELTHYEKKVLAKYKKELAVKKAAAEAKYNAEKASQSAAQAQNAPAPPQPSPSPAPAPQPQQTAAYGTPASNAAKSVATSKYSSEKVQGLANKDPKTLGPYEKKILAKYKTALKAELGKTVNTPASGAAAPQQSSVANKVDPESIAAKGAWNAIGKKYHNMQPETVKNLATGKWQPDPNKSWQVKAAAEGKEYLQKGMLPVAAPAPVHAYSPSKSEQIKASLLADPPPVTSHQTAQSNYAKQTDLLTASERNAVRSYTGSSYSHINGSLRTPGYVPSSTVLAIDKAISKSVASTELVLVRGVKSVDGLLTGNKPVVGAIMHDKGFMSTTRQVGTASSFSGGGYGLKIRVPAGRNVLPVQAISSHPSEDEFLLPRGSSFRVVSVNETSNTITVDLI